MVETFFIPSFFVYAGHLICRPIPLCHAQTKYLLAFTLAPLPSQSSGISPLRVEKSKHMQIFNRPSQTRKRKKLRNNSTEAEIILWSKLKNKQRRGARFRRQYGVGEYIVDFYACEYKLIIEVDGGVHLEKEVYENDKIKEEQFVSLGMTMLRFSNRDVMKNLSSVLDKIDLTITDLSSPRSGEVDSRSECGGARKQG